MDESKLSKGSADFVMAFADLSKRLAEIGIAVDTLKLHHGFFGCWELIATKGDEAVRFWFDGKDRYIEIEASPIRGYSAPNQWKKVEAKPLLSG